MATVINLLEVEENKTIVQSAMECGLTHAANMLHIKRQDLAGELREITSRAFDYFIYGFAKNLAATLALNNRNVKEAYVIGLDTAADLDAAEGRAPEYPVILLLVVERRTAALEEMVAHLNRTVTKSIADAFGLPEAPAVLLDVHIAEMAEKRERRGLSSFINSWWAPALKVLG